MREYISTQQESWSRQIRKQNVLPALKTAGSFRDCTLCTMPSRSQGVRGKRSAIDIAASEESVFASVQSQSAAEAYIIHCQTASTGEKWKARNVS